MSVGFVYRSVEVILSSMRVTKTSRKLTDLKEYACVNLMAGLTILMYVRKSISLSSLSFHIMKMSSMWRSHMDGLIGYWSNMSRSIIDKNRFA